MAKEAVVHLRSNVVFGRTKDPRQPRGFFLEREILLKNVLAIDTAGAICSVGILRHDGQRFLRAEQSAQSHSRCILSTIEALLGEAALSLSDLQRLVWNAGPGSFTGIRIAASVVQSLSYSLQIPFLSLSALEILAHAAVRTACNPSHTNQQLIKVAIDARMNGVYWANFMYAQGVMRRAEDDCLLSKDAFTAQCESLEDSAWVVGDAWPSAKSSDCVSATIEDLLALAQTKPMQDWQYRAEDCLPNYVQSSINWQKRTRYQTP